MKVAIIQSNFIPWRGYFDIIDDVDLFIYHDDLQYTKSDWRNRNRIKTPTGAAWVTVPVHYKNVDQLISETTIDYSSRWAQKIKNMITENYTKAPYFKELSGAFFEILLKKHPTISALNIELNAWIMKELHIDTEIKMSSDFEPRGTKTDRLIDILTKVGASVYLSGPAAKDYIEAEKFKEAGIGLAYKVYDYREYPQLCDPFEHHVTVLDMLFNCGSEAGKYLKSIKKSDTLIL